jgi:hypothetical protein
MVCIGMAAMTLEKETVENIWSGHNTYTYCRKLWLIPVTSSRCMPGSRVFNVLDAGYRNKSGTGPAGMTN